MLRQFTSGSTQAKTDGKSWSWKLAIVLSLKEIARVSMSLHGLRIAVDCGKALQEDWGIQPRDSLTVLGCCPPFLV